MPIKTLAPLLLLLLCSQAFAAEGKITISAPANGATVSAKNQLLVVYEATLGPKGDHLHLYLDEKRIEVLRQLKGSYELAALAPGKHHICLTENTKWHMSTGLESCVDVTAK